ncbi:MAG TPA: tRNA (adenosine(37)-N6)-dimethylallyltransferase MiaA [Candidatus Paceibacterota bacterium]|nr:tRNA (adenosine(37)-N6)-dimethylallyltransferase MiaA [Candidatus Paceibacterota bacterium]
MEKIKHRIIVIAGPTASGKSDIAIRLARRFNGEIISADSRQVYRGMDIGTGKVTKREQKLVRHRLLDVASPTRQYSVVRWRRAASHAIADALRRGKVPIVCGGTGFWIDALVYGRSIPDVRPDAKLRARLHTLTTPQLYARLRKLDPTRAAAIDRHNPVRLIRALEIVMKTGKPVPHAMGTANYDVLYLAVSRPMTTLKQRIERRLDARLKSGMVAEARRLRASGVSWKRLESFGLEYRWLALFLQHKMTRTEMRHGLLRDIIAYAKRQVTWWRRNTDIRRITGTVEAERLAKRFLSV